MNSQDLARKLKDEHLRCPDCGKEFDLDLLELFASKAMRAEYLVLMEELTEERKA
jgi:hypothetical protein